MLIVFQMQCNKKQSEDKAISDLETQEINGQVMTVSFDLNAPRLLFF